MTGIRIVSTSVAGLIDRIRRESMMSRVAREFIEAYDWILGVGPQPDCVLV